MENNYNKYFTYHSLQLNAILIFCVVFLFICTVLFLATRMACFLQTVYIIQMRIGTPQTTILNSSALEQVNKIYRHLNTDVDPS